MEAKIAQGYKQERETLMEQEKEAKRNEMLFRLRAQARHEDDRLAQIKHDKLKEEE